jgi:hypothetical protein
VKDHQRQHRSQTISEANPADSATLEASPGLEQLTQINNNTVHLLLSTETAEGRRLLETQEKPLLWRRWGPYVSERSWGTVREDYSSNGEAWDFVSHDVARSKAYRWGEDGLAAICDRYQLLVFGLALWNGVDPILKERAYGVTPREGNHGEDVKEYYFYLDSTPTHSYMKYLYKYPQAAYPYERLWRENQERRRRAGPEFELLDTGIFNNNRYFDVFVEYGKASSEDLCIRIEAFNRGPQPAPLHIIPQLWFRNTWAWSHPPGSVPTICEGPNANGAVSLIADDAGEERLKNLEFEYQLGRRYLYGQAGGRSLFTNNETNALRIYGVPSVHRHSKDAFHRAIVNNEPEAVNHDHTGTKACFDYDCVVPAGGSVVVRLRLAPAALSDPLSDVDVIIAGRRSEADEFYAAIHPPKATEDEKLIQRQAFAGLLWSKQIYLFDVNKWLEGDNPRFPPPASRLRIRNMHWRHLNSMRILSMPDKWEYPWFAAWDLAFHTVALALIDPEFAKEQLFLMLFEQFQHPSGQIPAYEWEFSDLNPPVHAWAVWRVYNTEKARRGTGDRQFLEKCFHKLLINFAWWVNKVDSAGNNVFEGGFLGLDNITAFDRSEKLPGGAVLEQSDGTGWMGMFCLNLMHIALELARENHAYESLALKFFEHYIYIGAAMKNMGGQKYSLWDEDDGFFYDVLRYPDGSFQKFRVRSLVGIIPLYAAEVLKLDDIESLQEFRSNFLWFIKNRRELTETCCHYVDDKRQYVLTIVNEEQLRRMVDRLLNPEEFLSSYGIRSMSKYHQQHPFVFGSSEVRYDPGESENKIKGGNSNWRGPIWFPTTFLIIESLRTLGACFGDDFKAGFPGDHGNARNLLEIAGEIATRMIRIFARNEAGHRPVYGENCPVFQESPHWRDCILFYEFYHGDNGTGLGASHQTGWSALVAALIEDWRR